MLPVCLKNLVLEFSHSVEISSRRFIKSDTETVSKSDDSWSQAEGKLLDALDANEHDDSFSSKGVESEIQSRVCPLSLFALAEGPRLRLLLATLQQFQKEAGIVSSTFCTFYHAAFPYRLSRSYVCL